MTPIFVYKNLCMLDGVYSCMFHNRHSALWTEWKPSACVLPSEWETKLTPIKNSVQDYRSGYLNLYIFR